MSWRCPAMAKLAAITDPVSPPLGDTVTAIRNFMPQIIIGMELRKYAGYMHADD